MKLQKVISWLSCALDIDAFDDVATNGLQIDREGDEITCVAFGVDASVQFLSAAAAAGAQLCVVHHGIVWGGGIRRLMGPEYRVVKTAMDHNLALFGAHLPLDANEEYGNNFEIARFLKLTALSRAFSYHGNLIGVIGRASRTLKTKIGTQEIALKKGQCVGVCSGGAGEFAVTAQLMGCDVFITGEANWGDQIAAENVKAPLLCCGHYETETFGVQALAKAMNKELGLRTCFLSRANPLC